MAPKKTRKLAIDPVVDLVGRLEVALSTHIPKLADAIGALNVTVATHTQRLDNVDLRANSHAGDIRRLEESQKDINTRISTVQQDLTEKLAAQTDSLKAHVDASVGKIVTLVKESDQKRETGDRAILARVTKLEIWRWMIVGAATLAGLILSGIIWKIGAAVIDKVDWLKLFGIH